MTSKSILDAVRGTGMRLHKEGARDATTMREFGTSCLPPVKRYSAKQIRKLQLCHE